MRSDTQNSSKLNEVGIDRVIYSSNIVGHNFYLYKYYHVFFINFISLCRIYKYTFDMPMPVTAI